MKTIIRVLLLTLFLLTFTVFQPVDEKLGAGSIPLADHHPTLKTVPNASSGLNFPDFRSVEHLNLVGNATQFGNRLRVTASAFGMVGAAWYDQKQLVQSGFVTTFQFQITDLLNEGADGLAFVVQNTNPSAIGPAGGGIGYGGLAGDRDGIPNCVAIELDTYRNSDQGDPNDNHISVQTRGTEPNSIESAYSLGTTTSIPNLKDGTIHTIRIEYLPGTLTIFIDDLSKPALSVAVNLASILSLDTGTAFVGFTSGTGGAGENHDVLSWSFSPSVTITGATYTKPILHIGGFGFGTSKASVVINGQDVTAQTINQSDTSIVLMGSKKKLHLKKVANQVKVTAGGIASNTFMFNL